MSTNVPLSATPAQLISAINLGGQACQIKVYQLDPGLFLDLYVNDALIIGGVLCLNQVRIVRNAYLGFIGDLMFTDTQTPVDGEGTDPVYTGLGGRYLLAYLDVTEITPDI